MLKVGGEEKVGGEGEEYEEKNSNLMANKFIFKTRRLTTSMIKLLLIIFLLFLLV